MNLQRIVSDALAEKIDSQLSQNYHATVIEIAGFGILIRGASGSGKSSLALGLLEQMSQSSIDAVLVGDDQVLISKENVDALIAKAPAATAGKIEIYGFGISEMNYKHQSKIGLIVGLVEAQKIERMPLPSNDTIRGVELPFVQVPSQHEQQSIRIVTAWLKSRAVI